jgi:hypothetical protein
MTRNSAQRLLILFNQLLIGKKLTTNDMLELLRERGFTVSKRMVQYDARIIYEAIDIVEYKIESNKPGHGKVYYIPADLRRLNYF